MSIKSENLIEVTGVKAGQRAILKDGKAILVGMGGMTASTVSVMAEPTVSANIVTIPVGYNETLKEITIPKTEATLSANVVTIPSGYHDANTLTVAESTITETTDKVTVGVGYVAEQKEYDISESIDLSFITAGSGDIIAGKVGADAEGNPVEGTIAIQAAGSISVFDYTMGVLSIPEGYYPDCYYGLPQGSTTIDSTLGNWVKVSQGWQGPREFYVGTAIEGHTITPSTENQTIAADSYLRGDIVISGDANFTEENIAEGVTLWGKTGTHSGGSSTEFYKCAEVIEASAGEVSGYLISGSSIDYLNGTYVFYNSFEDQDQTGFTYRNDSGSTLCMYENFQWFAPYIMKPNPDNSDLPEYQLPVCQAVLQGSETKLSDVTKWTDWGGGTVSFTLQELVTEGTPASWSGNLATIGEDGTFSFADTPQEGLEYGSNLTPVVGEVYPNGCLYKLNSFIEATLNQWKQLSNDIQAGLYTTDRIGEIIEVENIALDDVGLAAGTIQFEIVAVDNASLTDTTKSHSITLFAKNVLFAKPWDSGEHNRWSNSELRTYLQNAFFNCLDSDFSAQIASVNRTHWLYGGGEETVQDTVFLPSYTEIGFGTNEGISEGVQWNKMTSNEARQRDMNGQSYYWLSSANSDWSALVWVVGSEGSGYDVSNTMFGVVPALVIA